MWRRRCCARLLLRLPREGRPPAARRAGRRRRRPRQHWPRGLSLACPFAEAPPRVSRAFLRARRGGAGGGRVRAGTGTPTVPREGGGAGGGGQNALGLRQLSLLLLLQPRPVRRASPRLLLTPSRRPRAGARGRGRPGCPGRGVLGGGSSVGGARRGRLAPGSSWSTCCWQCRLLQGGAYPPDTRTAHLSPLSRAPPRPRRPALTWDDVCCTTGSVFIPCTVWADIAPRQVENKARSSAELADSKPLLLRSPFHAYSSAGEEGTPTPAPARHALALAPCAHAAHRTTPEHSWRSTSRRPSRKARTPALLASGCGGGAAEGGRRALIGRRRRPRRRPAALRTVSLLCGHAAPPPSPSGATAAARGALALPKERLEKSGGGQAAGPRRRAGRRALIIDCERASHNVRPRAAFPALALPVRPSHLLMIASAHPLQSPHLAPTLEPCEWPLHIRCRTCIWAKGPSQKRRPSSPCFANGEVLGSEAPAK